MTLHPGDRLGPYEIIAAIGAGGMGEVYRARDTRLDRTIAIKVLPEHLLRNSEARQRFEREARAVAALNHPHICVLHDIGRHVLDNGEGIDFLVLEYLEGETLAARLARGPLPIEEVLRYGIQMADALDKAHAKGITHRDLKPGNMMLTKSGTKLLDFGLAKAKARETPVAAATVSDQLTAVGAVVGTFQYISPEQLQGRDADARSDIFSFGAVLYEMITGRKAFGATDPATLIAGILTGTPAPISESQPGALAAALDRAIRRCLAKDPDGRWQSARDLTLELEAIAAGDVAAVAAAPVTAAPPARGRQWFPWALFAAAALVAAVLAVAHFRRPTEEPGSTKTLVLPEEKTTFGDAAVISPDGRVLAFLATSTGQMGLWIRPLDSLTARLLSGTEGAMLPFWSPDSRSLGFFAGGKLKKVDTSGGAPQTLADAPQPTGGSWSPEGVMLFAPNRSGGLHRVPAAGGAATPVTELDSSRQENSHRWPLFLPGGRHFLYMVRSARPEHMGFYAAGLDSRNPRRVLPTESLAAYAPGLRGGPGHLLYLRAATLMAQPFDSGALQPIGSPFPVAESVMAGTGIYGLALFSASANGVLAYRTGSAVGNMQLVWFDRQGKRLEAVGAPAPQMTPRLSPDGKRLAVARAMPGAGTLDLWLIDLARGNAASRFTFNPAVDWFPVWSPDGSRIVFSSPREGPDSLWQKPSSGAGQEELLHKAAFGSGIFAADWSVDGRFLSYSQQSPKTGLDVWVLPGPGGPPGDRKPFPFLQTEFSESAPRFSPDPQGPRWIAYQSDESSQPEVYVQSFQPVAGAGGKWQISTGGGTAPIWRRDGKELFYLAPDGTIMSVDIQAGSSFQAGVPRAFPVRAPAFADALVRYDVTADGRRFLVVTAAEESGPSPIVVVTNWTAGLKR